jgi:hypothetical protein
MASLAAEEWPTYQVHGEQVPTFLRDDAVRWAMVPVPAAEYSERHR